MALIYVELTDGSEEIPNNLLAIMLRQRHCFNPDFASQYASVVKWHLEVDQGAVLREIGLTADGRPVAIGPFGRNDGLWGSIPCTFGSPHEPRVDPGMFQKNWDLLASELGHRILPKITEPVKPVGSSSDIGGSWTNGSQGSMSDDTIAFFPDRRGYLQTSNGGDMWYYSFRWQLVAPGYIAIDGDQFVQKDNEGKVVSVPSNLHLPNVRAETEVKHFGDSSAIKFLYLRTAATEKWRPPENLHFPQWYYRCPVQPERHAFPEFGD